MLLAPYLRVPQNVAPQSLPLPCVDSRCQDRMRRVRVRSSGSRQGCGWLLFVVIDLLPPRRLVSMLTIGEGDTDY